MSLRWRLCLALAALAALATTVMASVAYTSTSDRLTHEVDRSLTERLDGPGRVMGGRIGRHAAAVAAAGTADLPRQLLDRSGQVVVVAGSVPLPVDATDRMLASGAVPAGTTRFRTVAVDGDPHRIATQAVAGGAVQVARSVSENERVLDALRRRFAVIGAAVVAGAAAVGYLVARRSTGALEQLTRTAEYVTGTGNLDVPMGTAIGRSDETGRLARALATMLDALDRSRRQQRDLVQDASHELRTPITSMRTNLDVLARHPDLDPEARRTIVAELRAELGELGDLLAELVAGAAEGDPGDAVMVSLDSVARQLAERTVRRHDRPVEVIGTGAAVVAPPAGLARAVGNLLENSVKFSPPGSPVTVELDGGAVWVVDDGPGIDPAEADRVFDRFYRSPASRTLPGSGLGLAIVRQVVEGAGGSVEVRPRTPDSRPAVGFRLPTAAADTVVGGDGAATGGSDSTGGSDGAGRRQPVPVVR